MSTPTTLIIGKNAKTGSRVDALLTRMGHPTRAVSRSTTPAFDWEDPTGWAQAMAGCKRGVAAYPCGPPFIPNRLPLAPASHFSTLAAVRW